MITLDKREKTTCRPDCGPTCFHKHLLASVDEVAFLKVPNPNSAAHPWSFDIQVTTKAGEVWRFEAKWNVNDAVDSWLDREADGHSRLGRQMSYTDGLLVVWDEGEILMDFPPERLPTCQAVRSWLFKKSLQGKPVSFFGSADELLKALRYLERQKEPLRCPQTSLIAPNT